MLAEKILRQRGDCKNETPCDLSPLRKIDKAGAGHGGLDFGKRRGEVASALPMPTRCHHEGYATLPPEVWAGSKLVWDAPLSELSPEEAERFAQLPPISVDEVLDFYDALKYIDRIPRALLEKLSSHTKTTTKAALSPRYQKRMLHGS